MTTYHNSNPSLLELNCRVDLGFQGGGVYKRAGGEGGAGFTSEFPTTQYMIFKRNLNLDIFYWLENMVKVFCFIF